MVILARKYVVYMKFNIFEWKTFFFNKNTFVVFDLSDKKEDGEYVSEKHERVEIEYKNPSYEDEQFEREYVNEHDERKLEEHELSDDNLYDEHGFDQDGYRKERHDVVRERQKKKELEVFVGGLDRDTTEVDLREVFSEIGDITEVRLLMNPMTNKNKGFAFIRFATVEQARRALNDFKRPMVIVFYFI